MTTDWLCHECKKKPDAAHRWWCSQAAAQATAQATAALLRDRLDVPVYVGTANLGPRPCSECGHDHDDHDRNGPCLAACFCEDWRPALRCGCSDCPGLADCGCPDEDCVPPEDAA